MKRGFLKTSRYKKAVEEVDGSTGTQLPLAQKMDFVAHQPDETHGAKTSPSSDATNVEIKMLEDVCASALCVTQSDDPQEKTLRTSCECGNGDKKTLYPDTKDRKGKGNTTLVETGDDIIGALPIAPDYVGCIPPRPFPRPPGWGRDPKEDFFHTVPKSLTGGSHRKRAIFRHWPRDTNAKPFEPSDYPLGKMSPDGYPWAETLYDLFGVYRLADVPNYVSYTRGSALCEQMKATGEVDFAAPEIAWAESEGEPRIGGAAGTGELIRSIDAGIRMGLFCQNDSGGQEAKTKFWDEGESHNKSQEILNKQAPEEDSGNKEGGVENEEGKAQCSKYGYGDTIPITSPFHPSHYPKPWPFIPFENPLSILLQERIPLHLLPRTLYVHDPFCLLTVREHEFCDTSWASRPDILRTYNLRLSDPVRLKIEGDRRKAEELEEFKARTLVVLRYERTKEQIKNHEPMIEVPLPPYPRRPTKIEEGHLYLSPIAKVGEGHHSMVYKAEWELPRDIFMKQRICQLCFEESTDKEIRRLKDTGRWDKLLGAASWGPNGFTGRMPTQAELDAVSDTLNLEKDGEIIEREITCVVSARAAPSQVVDIIDNKSDVWSTLMKDRQRNTAKLYLARNGGDEDEGTPKAGSYVACIRLDPPFTYESQKSCAHKAPFEQGPTPLTAKFTVVAKLSLEDDPHLAREASNYQEFPEHFFDHYNGYDLISQLHCAVPVSAIAPQFYGYYTPNQEKGENPGEPSYLSPILLLEHCGQPIEPEELSEEDQQECASLILRFQRAGWLHGSVAPRNFLVQFGKPTEFPFVREYNREPSFRLIDFGRSRKYSREEVREKRQEEMVTVQMFRKLALSMSYTLSM